MLSYPPVTSITDKASCCAAADVVVAAAAEAGLTADVDVGGRCAVEGNGTVEGGNARAVRAGIGYRRCRPRLRPGLGLNVRGWVFLRLENLFNDCGVILKHA